MDDKLDLILQKLESLDSRMLNMESTQRQHGDILTQLIKIVGVTNEKVIQTNEKLEATLAQSTLQSKRTDRLRDRLSAVEEQLDLSQQ